MGSIRVLHSLLCPVTFWFGIILLHNILLVIRKLNRAVPNKFVKLKFPFFYFILVFTVARLVSTFTTGQKCEARLNTVFDRQKIRVQRLDSRRGLWPDLGSIQNDDIDMCFNQIISHLHLIVK